VQQVERPQRERHTIQSDTTPRRRNHRGRSCAGQGCRGSARRLVITMSASRSDGGHLPGRNRGEGSDSAASTSVRRDPELQRPRTGILPLETARASLYADHKPAQAPASCGGVHGSCPCRTYMKANRMLRPFRSCGSDLQVRQTRCLTIGPSGPDA